MCGRDLSTRLESRGGITKAMSPTTDDGKVEATTREGKWENNPKKLS
jgi:hypothetical protein